MSKWYFSQFEDRKPPRYQPPSDWQMFSFHVLATTSIALGFWYLAWRWTNSLNWEALGFSLALVTAETLAFIGTVLFFVSLWNAKDVKKGELPFKKTDIGADAYDDPTRPLAVDVYFPTYNEDIELVRLSIQDAKKMYYRHPIDINIFILDDGDRESMADMAKEEGVHYFSRLENTGFKAGNIRNGLEHSYGDLLVIFDADTRPFPEFLEKTLGYFCDPKMAWVQTPQWFYDLDEGVALPLWLDKKWKLGRFGSLLGHGIEKIVGRVHMRHDVLGNDPSLFYDVIQHRRNWCNASFCCGAGSIHRREAVMQAALKRFVSDVDKHTHRYVSDVKDESLRPDYHDVMRLEAAKNIEFSPYKFHVSEDIYTGMLLHADTEKDWHSAYHPEVLSKMLSPQDLLSWAQQRFKYAGGTLDIFRNDNPLKQAGLSFWQKWMYFTTVFSYLSPLWTIMFLMAPIIFFFSGIAPVAAYDKNFYAHIVPFLVVNRIAFMVGTWGTSTTRGEQYYLAFFWQNLQAMWEVMCRLPIKFKTTSKVRQRGRFYALVWPQILMIFLTIVGAVYMGIDVYLGLEEHVPAYLVNLFWAFNNIYALFVIVHAAILEGQEHDDV
ncbi:MAG: glycosyltransferase [Mariprofundaceae bacterium]|nr:glycosyltransferase [Mariprofundaceae bacterium]